MPSFKFEDFPAPMMAPIFSITAKSVGVLAAGQQSKASVLAISFSVRSLSLNVCQTSSPATASRIAMPPSAPGSIPM